MVLCPLAYRGCLFIWGAQAIQQLWFPILHHQVLSGDQLHKLEEENSLANSFMGFLAAQELSYSCVLCNSRYETADLLVIALFSTLAASSCFFLTSASQCCAHPLDTPFGYTLISCPKEMLQPLVMWIFRSLVLLTTKAMIWIIAASAIYLGK